jgi:hypothetical protein
VAASVVAGDAALKVDGASSLFAPDLTTSAIQVLWRWTTYKEPASQTAPVVITPVFDEAPLSRSQNLPDRLSPQ